MEDRLESLREVEPTFAALNEALSVGQRKKADDGLTSIGWLMCASCVVPTALSLVRDARHS